MNNEENHKKKLSRDVGKKEERKQRARQRGKTTIWFGLGMFGLVGWSVAVPVLIGTALGLWLDSRFESGISWTLMLMAAGIIAGALNAWFWVTKERREIEKERSSGRENDE